jgi:hypothetical protein
MKDADLDYANMAQMIKSYTDKGRPISIAFLNWFLEHIYRLDQVAAEDVICDKSNDRGISEIKTLNFSCGIVEELPHRLGVIGLLDRYRLPPAL